MFKSAKVTKLQKHGSKYRYKNRLWTLNQPVRSDRKGHRLMVLATKRVNGSMRAKIVYFGSKKRKYHSILQATFRRFAKAAGVRMQRPSRDPWNPNFWIKKVLTAKPARRKKLPKNRQQRQRRRAA